MQCVLQIIIACLAQVVLTHRVINTCAMINISVELFWQAIDFEGFTMFLWS